MLRVMKGRTVLLAMALLGIGALAFVYFLSMSPPHDAASPSREHPGAGAKPATT
jgi:hypothetical protein